MRSKISTRALACRNDLRFGIQCVWNTLIMAIWVSKKLTWLEARVSLAISFLGQILFHFNVEVESSYLYRVDFSFIYKSSLIGGIDTFVMDNAILSWW